MHNSCQESVWLHLKEITTRPDLIGNIDRIIPPIEFILSNNYFYNNYAYKQVKGSMGGLVSPVIANLCMEEIKE